MPTALVRTCRQRPQCARLSEPSRPSSPDGHCARRRAEHGQLRHFGVAATYRRLCLAGALTVVATLSGLWRRRELQEESYCCAVSPWRLTARPRDESQRRPRVGDRLNDQCAEPGYAMFAKEVVARANDTPSPNRQRLPHALRKSRVRRSRSPRARRRYPDRPPAARDAGRVVGRPAVPEAAA